MSDVLQTGRSWLASMQKRHQSQAVTYSRGSQSVTIDATIDRTIVETTDENGTVVRAQIRDYLIDAADLILGGAMTLPARGDRVTEVATGVTYVYEVLPLGPQGEIWRYSDPYRLRLRIHATQVG